MTLKLAFDRDSIMVNYVKVLQFISVAVAGLLSKTIPIVSQQYFYEKKNFFFGISSSFVNLTISRNRKMKP